MNNLFTGGAVFISFYLINRLIDKSKRLVFLDNFLNINYANILKWVKNKLFEIKKYYITKPINIDQALNYVLNIWKLSYRKN